MTGSPFGFEVRDVEWELEELEKTEGKGEGEHFLIDLLVVYTRKGLSKVYMREGIDFK